MKKSKYLAMAISVALILVIALVACNQQAQVAEEPSQEVQQTEPVVTEPAVQPMEANTSATTVDTGHQDEPEVKESDPVEESAPPVEATPEPTPIPKVTEPVEVKESEPVEESAPPVEATPAPTPIPTESPKQEQTTTNAPENVPTENTPPAQQEDEGQQQEDGTTQQGTVGVDGVDNWDQEVYDMLDPDQQEVYRNASASSRVSFNRKVRNTAKRQEEGWTTEWHEPTGEEWAEQWSHIRVGN